MAVADRRTMMKLSVSLMALMACCLVAVRTLPAQDAPAAPTEPGITVITTFPGDTGPGPKDVPDNSGAVGPDHVVDFTNANVVIHDKKTCKLVRQTTQADFRKAANPDFKFPKLTDPRLLYDPLSKRWFAVIAEAANLSVGYLVVSESSDPPRVGRRSNSRWN